MQSLSQSPLDPDFVQDPYPFYARMRAEGPLVRWADYRVVCATDYATIDTLLRDRRFGRAPIIPVVPPPHLKDFYAIEAHSMLELEPPRHTQLRGAALRAFTNRRIDALRPEITALCDALIDAFPEEGPFDLLEAYARPLPARIIARLLGVPEASWPDLLRWSNAMVAMYQAGRTVAQEHAAAEAARTFAAFITEQIARKCCTPEDDLISALIAAPEGARLSDAEIITTCILLLNAGHEATVHTFGNAVKVILEQGVVPQSDAAFIDEVLRFDPPLHMFDRVAYEPVEIAGHRFQRGDRVALLLASANRDETVFPQADTFRPARAGAKPLSFGAGLHFCIGAALARLELEIMLTRLWARMPDLRVSQAPRYANIYHFHGLEALWVSPASTPQR
jgi:cytochrome P450